MKKIYIFIIVLIFFSINDVFAESNIYYINNRNMTFTHEQYDFVSNFYFVGYQDYISAEEYNAIIQNEYYLYPIEHIEKNMFDFNKDSFYETSSKKLSANKVCNNDCFVSSILTWKKIPGVKSYDVFGARMITGSLNFYSIITNVISNDSVNTINGGDIKSNGFGVSFKIPSSTSDSLTITQSFRISNDGSVRVAYQHAKRVSSLSKSKDYTINSSGYGGVFNFKYSSYYDGMNGLSI